MITTTRLFGPKVVRHHTNHTPRHISTHLRFDKLHVFRLLATSLHILHFYYLCHLYSATTAGYPILTLRNTQTPSLTQPKGLRFSLHISVSLRRSSTVKRQGDSSPKRMGDLASTFAPWHWAAIVPVHECTSSATTNLYPFLSALQARRTGGQRFYSSLLLAKVFVNKMDISCQTWRRNTTVQSFRSTCPAIVRERCDQPTHTHALTKQNLLDYRYPQVSELLSHAAYPVSLSPLFRCAKRMQYATRLSRSARSSRASRFPR
jgi:hypothetical protein